MVDRSRSLDEQFGLWEIEMMQRGGGFEGVGRWEVAGSCFLFLTNLRKKEFVFIFLRFWRYF